MGFDGSRNSDLPVFARIHFPLQSMRRIRPMKFAQEAELDGALGDVFGRVFVPQQHPVGDAKLRRQQLLVDGMFRVIGTHPTSAHLGRGK